MGGKGLHLIEMVKLRLPVPFGYVVTTKAFDYFMGLNNNAEIIQQIIDKTGVDDTKNLIEASDKIKKMIAREKGRKIIFLFKVLDSLEALKRNYSKKLLAEIVPLAEKTIVSFSTESMLKRKKFAAKRNWIIDFINERFKILDDFEIGGERYIVFKREK